MISRAQGQARAAALAADLEHHPDRALAQFLLVLPLGWLCILPAIRASKITGAIREGRSQPDKLPRTTRLEDVRSRACLNPGNSLADLLGGSVIQHSGFSVEPWCLREIRLDLEVLAQSESVFALSNGHIGWRANLDEGEPHGLPGSYLNGVYEERPLPYAEAAYGFPESGQTMINVTNGKLIRLLVDDEPFDVRYGVRVPRVDSAALPRCLRR